MSILIETKVFSKTSIRAQHPTIEVFVDEGYTMTGGGAWIDYQEPGNLLQQSYPIQGSGGQWNGWRVYGKDCWVPSLAKITAYAIGIKVTKDGEPVEIEQTVVKELEGNAVLPDGWVGVGGGSKCDQNIYENVLLADSTPPNEGDAVTSWGGAKQYCGSPNSTGGPTGGGSITNFLIAIRAQGIKFITKIYRDDSDVDSRPIVEVSGHGEVVVSGGALIKEAESSCWTGNNEEEKIMLTSSYPSVADDGKVTGWIATGKDHNVTSPGAIRASVVTLTAQ